MAAIGKQVAVDSSGPVLLVTARYATLLNKGAASAFLGGPNVTSADGYELAAGDVIEVDGSYDDVYAICAAASSTTVDVLAVRKAF